MNKVLPMVVMITLNLPLIRCGTNDQNIVSENSIAIIRNDNYVIDSVDNNLLSDTCDAFSSSVLYGKLTGHADSSMFDYIHVNYINRPAIVYKMIGRFNDNNALYSLYLTKNWKIDLINIEDSSYVSPHNISIGDSIMHVIKKLGKECTVYYDRHMTFTYDPNDLIIVFTAHDSNAVVSRFF